jgi:hypothetical protein
MKRLIFLLSISFLFFINKSNSQVVVTPPLLSHGGNPTLVQLMYGVLNNTSSSGMDVYLQLVCTTQGQLVGDVKSKTFLLPAGVTLINAQNAENLLYPVEVKYADNKYVAYGVRTSTLPTGTYEICVTVFKAMNDSIVGKNCFSISIENFTSVNLLTPMNNSVNKNLYPIFTWSKVTGTESAFSNDIYYSLKIVEIFDEQSSVIAIQANPSVFKEEEINFNLFQYPVTSHPLEACKKYAWQIEAFQGIGVNKKSLIKSEIWSFRIECEQQVRGPIGGVHPDDIPPNKKSKKSVAANNTFYYSVSLDYPSSVIDIKDTLFLQFENNYSSGSNQLTYTIRNLTNNKTSPVTKLDLTSNQGLNRITLPIQNSVVAKGESGILTLYDNKKYYYLSFKRITDKVTNAREK